MAEELNYADYDLVAKNGTILRSAEGEEEDDEIEDAKALEKREEVLEVVDQKTKALANAGFKLNKLLLNAIRLGVADLKFLKETENLFKKL